MCAKWNTTEYNPNILIDALEQIKSVDASGKYEGFKGGYYDEWAGVLYSALKIPSDLPTHEVMDIVHIAIRNVATRNELSSDKLIREISSLERQYVKRPYETFVLITSLSINYSDHIRRRTIANCRITINKRVPKQFVRKPVLDRAPNFLHADLPTQYSAVQVSVQARSEFEAQEKALDALDLLRGIWNLCLNQWGYTRSSGFKREPISQVLVGPLHTLHKVNGELATTTFWFDPEYIGPVKCIDLGNHGKLLQAEEQKIRRSLAKNPFKEEVEAAIRRYAKAMDTRDRNASFLELWGILETLTATSFDRYEVTIKRTSFLWDQKELNKQVLNHLRHYRNRLAHVGERSPEIDMYLRPLRRYVHGLLVFHIYNVFRFSSIKDAAEFLDLPSDLTNIQETMQMRRKQMRLLKKALKFRA
jgi:hypothetical protein